MSKNTTTISMLQAVDAITCEAVDSNLDYAYKRKVRPAAKVIAEKLGLTENESIVLALFMEHAFDKCIEIATIFDGTKCPTSKKLELLNDIESLVSKHYLVNSQTIGQNGYRIPGDVVKAFQHNEAYHPKEYGNMSLKELLLVLEDLFDARDEDGMPYHQLIDEISRLFDANKQLEFVRKIRSYKLADDEKLLLVFFCQLYSNLCEEHVDWHDLDCLFDNRFIAHHVQSSLYDGSHILMEKNFIENSNDNGFVNRESFRLTDYAKDELLGDLKIKTSMRGKKLMDVVKSKDIKIKKLFFPSSVDSIVRELNDILQEKRYKEICQRMMERGFHCGFTCLFYGTPGTGKTETAYQLAKSSGRDIMIVDIPAIRNMYVGESEKNVKGIFVRYANLMKESKHTPILLFNEADALIGKRKSNHNSAVDKMENTMQNILLQEMENLNGILIATTNLQENLDHAFDRRFLYKVKFEKPDIISSEKIWHEKIPEIGSDTIKRLSQRYELSGGQIENVARRYAIRSILNDGGSISANDIEQFCEMEAIKKGGNIGFRI